MPRKKGYRKKLPPLPRKGDIVERQDFSRMFGRIVKIKGNRLRINWNDDLMPKETWESPSNIALVERKRF